MKPQPSHKRSHAFTFVELLMVIAVVFILLIFFDFGVVGNAKAKAQRIRCVSNLKSLGVGCRLWAGDNGNLNPMQLMLTNNGVLEPAITPTSSAIFEVMSNELSDPRILICPADAERSPATNFNGKLLNQQISYFVGLDATETNPYAFFSGDRNITNGLGLHNGVLELTTNQPAGWTGEIHNNAGNIGLADGSVQQLTTGNLRKAVEATGLATNRLAMP